MELAKTFGKLNNKITQRTYKAKLIGFTWLIAHNCPVIVLLLLFPCLIILQDTFQFTISILF